MRELDGHVRHTIIRLLSEYTGQGVHAVAPQPGQRQQGLRPDLVLNAGTLRFVVEVKASGAAAPVAAALRALEVYRTAWAADEETTTTVVPLLVVPFMGDVGKGMCSQSDISWLDLAGNAQFTAPGLRVWIEGRRNTSERRTPAANPFAPRAARITRHLLLAPKRVWTQTTLAQETGLEKGFVSKVVRALIRQELLTDARDQRSSASPNEPGSRSLRLVDPNALLDAWREAYDFEKHDVHRGVIAARSGPELLNRLAIHFKAQKGSRGRYAATGLAAAARLAPYADFRTVSIYCEELPEPEVLADLGFQPAEQGGNVWFVIPNDSDIFAGTQEIDDIPCVSAAQAYVDLFAHPERARDAASELRARCLSWDWPVSASRSAGHGKPAARSKVQRTP